MMGFLKQRRSQRVDVDNFTIFYLLDEDGKILKGGFGKTINVSDVGLLLETREIINTEYVLVSITDGRETIFEMKGKVKHSRKGKNGYKYTGIELIGDDDKKSEFAKLFKKASQGNHDLRRMSSGF